ncbi:hypothetical protein BS47DRAFT_242588 [Hydnum rufescens UP504]|uniref:Uncharacterized protein n=1 Tax=Hydnum rufescens UP504 TaxID=1448309 RepID=A0A9P6DMT6_9AGAM|nr:hypothetical protein BS47DRAFT_242588 [Hydnum rufescens UP504]
MLNPKDLPDAKLEARNVAVGILETIAARQQMKNADAFVPEVHRTVALDPRPSLHASPLEPPSPQPRPFAMPPAAQSSQRIRRSLPQLMFRRATSFRDSTGSDSSSSSSPLTPQTVEPDCFPSPPPISRQARVSAEVIVPGQSNISRSRDAFAHGVYGSIDEEEDGFLGAPLARTGARL